jgi:hypothetical protein
MKLLSILGLATLVVGTGAVLYAAPDGGDIGGSGSATLATAADTQLSFSEMLSRSKLLHDGMLSDLRHVVVLQQKARKEKDIIKLNCVNDKLVMIKPEMNIEEQSQLSLEGSSDGADRPSLFAEVRTSAESVRRLRDEADQCIGEPQISSESSNGYTHPDIPDSPYGQPFSPELEPPGYASPFN